MGKALIVRPRVPTAISAGTGTAAGTSTAYLYNDFIGMVWRSTVASGADYFDVDFGAAVSIDTVALLSTNGAASVWTVAGAASQAGLAAISRAALAISIT